MQNLKRLRKYYMFSEISPRTLSSFPNFNENIWKITPNYNVSSDNKIFCIQLIWHFRLTENNRVIPGYSNPLISKFLSFKGKCLKLTRAAFREKFSCLFEEITNIFLRSKNSLFMLLHFASH